MKEPLNYRVNNPILRIQISKLLTFLTNLSINCKIKRGKLTI